MTTTSPPPPEVPPWAVYMERAHAAAQSQSITSKLTLDEALSLGLVLSVKELRDSDQRFADERDRRYLEVNIEREKALKIKETADLAALSLARQIQDYKDEKANELREQISAERGHYATKDDMKVIAEKFDAQIAPIVDFVAGTRGKSVGTESLQRLLFALLGAAGIAWGIWQHH